MCSVAPSNLYNENENSKKKKKYYQICSDGNDNGQEVILAVYNCERILTMRKDKQFYVERASFVRYVCCVAEFIGSNFLFINDDTGTNPCDIHYSMLAIT